MVSWEVIRIIIDILSVINFLVMLVVLYFAYKSFQKVMHPINTVKSMIGGLSMNSVQDNIVEDDK